MNDHPRVITGHVLGKALADAGIIHDLDRVSRIVIEASCDDPVRLYVERFGDERLVDIVPALVGVEVREKAEH